MSERNRLREYTQPGTWPPRRRGRLAARIHDLHEGAYPRLGEAAWLAGGYPVRGLALIGLADDRGVRLNGGRPGADQGPDAFRSGLAGYGSAESVGLQGLDAPILDLGNVIPGNDLHETHARVTATVSAVLELDLMPIGVGGGHDLTFPEVRALIDSRFRPAGQRIDGVYFDAHLDVREEDGSGMPFRRLIEQGGLGRLSLFGFDPLVNSPEHLDWFLSNGGELAEWSSAQWPGDRAQFVSICLDVLDMAQAPGVSAPNPAGWSVQRLADYAEAAGRQSSVCCLDLMELSPPYDKDGRTARAAAYLFLRFLSGFAGRKKAAL